MKKKYKKINPSPSVRAPVEHEGFIKRSRPIRALSRKKSEVKPESEKTLLDLYEENLLEIQNKREWTDEVCRQYDRVMMRDLAPLVKGYRVIDITLDDYLKIWETFLRTHPSNSKEDRAYMLIRYLAEIARDKGLSSVYFYNFKEMVRSKKYQRKKKVKNTGTDAMEYELRGMRIARSLSPEAELRFLLAALDKFLTEGEYIAGVLMFLLGLRTSEACGVLYRDLVEVVPGYWGIMRRTVRDLHKGTIELDSKTENGYRLIPIPRFLASILLERKEKFEERFPDQNVEKWPISCRGTNYSVSADQKRVNARMESLYHETGCDEDLMALALYDMRSEEEIREECENSLVAYLGRHQMITEMVAVGMPEKFIFALAGHAQRDYTADAADLTNADFFVEASDYLNRRPVIWLLDSSMKTFTMTVSKGSKMNTFCDGDAEIAFCSDEQKPIPFMLEMTERECSDPIILEKSGEISFKEFKLPALSSGTAPLCVAPMFRKMANAIRNSDDDHELIKDEDEYPEGFQFSILEHEPSPGPQLPKRPSYRKKKLQNTKKQKEEPASVSGITMYVVDSKRKTAMIEKDKLVISPRNTVGKKLEMSGKSQIKAIVPYAAANQNYVISRSGTAYVCPGVERLDELLTDSKYEELLQEFVQGAILLSLPDGESPDKLILLTNLGNIVCMSTEWLQKIRGSIQLAKLSEEEEIVSACFLESDQDLLIITRKGNALRLAASSIHKRKGKGTQPQKGIKLSDDDSAVVCMPYVTDLIIAKENGQLAAINRLINPISTCGSGGIKLTEGSKVVSVIKKADAIALVDSSGYMIIVDAKGFSFKTRNQGVNAKKLPRDSKLICAIGLNSENKND